MNPPTCHQCGSNGLVAGALQSTGTVHFRPVGAKFLSLVTAEVAINSFMCPSCGAIQMRGDTEKLNRVMDRPSPAKASQKACSTRA